MTPGSIFFDRNFAFQDGESGEKLFVIIGTHSGTTVVAKTTSRPYGKGINYGCQPDDRFHNFHLPSNTCYLKKVTWICLDEFYEFNNAQLLQKRFSGDVNYICDLEEQIAREVQECALQSLDLSPAHGAVIQASLLASELASTSSQE